MKEIISILDFVSAIGIIVSLNLVQRSAKAWLLYSASCFIFAGVMVYNHVPGMTIMGLILTVTGVKNYLKSRQRWYSNHLSTCGTKYRGCGPNCPVANKFRDQS